MRVVQVLTSRPGRTSDSTTPPPSPAMTMMAMPLLMSATYELNAGPPEPHCCLATDTAEPSTPADVLSDEYTLPVNAAGNLGKHLRGERVRQA